MTLYDANGPGPLARARRCRSLFGALAFAGLGFGAAALIRSAEGSSAVVNLVILPMAFLSGSFGPTRSYPQVLQTLADVLPLTYYNQLLRSRLPARQPDLRRRDSHRRGRGLGPRRLPRRVAPLQLDAARAKLAGAGMAPPSRDVGSIA